MSENIFSLFTSRFPSDPSVPFLLLPDGAAISYAELGARTGRLANVIVARGVQPGDRVAVHVEKSSEALLLYLACLRAGAVYLPLNPGYTVPEVRYFIGDAEPALFVCRPHDEGVMASLAAQLGVRQMLTLGEQGEGTLVD